MPNTENDLFDQVANQAPEPQNINLSSAQLLVILALSTFAVLSHWSVWNIGILSMGWNTSVVWLGLFLMLAKKNAAIEFRQDWWWLTPLIVISLSFAIYENPWLKTISFFVLPFIAGFLFTFGQLSEKFEQVWSSSLVMKLAQGVLSGLPFLPVAFRMLLSRIFHSAQLAQSSVAKRLLNAVLILIPLLSIILILLSSADANFANRLGAWSGVVFSFFDWSVAAKAVWIILLSTSIIAVYAALRRPINFSPGTLDRNVDGLVAGVVLGIVLVFYVVFLSFQLDYLLVDKLPIEFAETERLVKSGFWQLFFLSGINIGLFYWAYKNTGWVAQWILRAYLIASALILLSACWRMGLYVFFYGLSYEKFFASYTALYALFLFSFLVWAAFSYRRRDIVKFVIISALWAYSIATMLPVERLIFSTNIQLAQQPASRIELFHLTALSNDVLSLAESAINNGELEGRNWQYWLAEAVQQRCDRRWYETNLSNQLNCEWVGHSGTSADVPSPWR